MSNLHASGDVTAYILSALIGYAFGSFPTAYVLVKWKHRIDIRQAGSGSVGTMNVFDVTGSRRLGTMVLIVDMLKGTLPVLIVLTGVSVQFEVLATAGLCAITGHSFPVWLGFRGGRGLATTAGVMLVIGWVFIVVWIALWATAYLPTRSIHAANIIASVCSPAIIAVMPSTIGQTLPPFTSSTDLMFFGISFCTIILITHRKPITDFFKNRQR